MSAYSAQVGTPQDTYYRDVGQYPGMEVPLSWTEMQECWRAKEHPSTAMCLEEIRKKIFSGGGLVVMQHGTEQTPSPGFKYLLEKFYDPLARDAFDLIQAIGIVVVMFRIENTPFMQKTPVPYIPKWGTYGITTYHEDGVQKFRVYKNVYMHQYGNRPYPPENYDPSALVLHGFGYDPELNGELRSNMKRLVPELLFRAELQSCALTAERINQAPPMVLEYHETRTQEADERLRRGEHPGETTQAEDLADLQFERTERERREFMRNVAEIAHRNGQDPYEMFHVRDLGIHGNPERLAPASGVDWRGHQMPWANTYMLPQTRRVANVQRAHARGDFVAITQQVQRTVCGVLNIPESVFSNTSSVKAGVNLVEMSIMYTVNKHERTLARKVLQPVYDHSIARLFRNELAHLGLKPMLKHKDKYEDAPTREQISEDSLFTEGASWNVTFAFDLPPATTPEHLQHMYDEGIIGRRVYAESMLRVNHMGSDKRNPLDTDDEKDDANERRQRLASKHADARQRAPKGRKNLRSGIQKRTGRNFTTPSCTLAQSHYAQSTRHKDRHEDALR